MCKCCKKPSGEAPDGALALAADVTDPDALAQALSAATEAHGPIEVLVASAGINWESLAARTSSQMWDEVISADLTGTRSRSEERRVGKECRSRWSPYH